MTSLHPVWRHAVPSRTPVRHGLSRAPGGRNSGNVWGVSTSWSHIDLYPTPGGARTHLSSPHPEADLPHPPSRAVGQGLPSGGVVVRVFAADHQSLVCQASCGLHETHMVTGGTADLARGRCPALPPPQTSNQDGSYNCWDVHLLSAINQSQLLLLTNLPSKHEMMLQCWASVVDGGPTLKQHWPASQHDPLSRLYWISTEQKILSKHATSCLLFKNSGAN